MEIPFKIFSNKAVQPFLATPGSTSFDLCSTNNYLIYPNSVQGINTNIGVAIPHSFTRSSWAIKFTSVEGGVIDSDYRGKIKVICHDKSSNWHKTVTGKSIAQIAFFRSKKIKFVKVSNFEDKTLRGDKGLGSTDKK